MAQLDENTKNNLIASISGDFLRALVANEEDGFSVFEHETNRIRACHVSLALAQDYVNALELHLGGDENGSH